MQIRHHKASYEYELLERLEAGVALLGPEVKSLREGRASLDGSFVRLIGGEAYLVGAKIHPYSFSRVENYDPQRTRKLLLHRKEIVRLIQRVHEAGLTLVPLSLYEKKGYIKLEFAVGKGKKQFEKREKLRRKAETRDLERSFRGKLKR